MDPITLTVVQQARAIKDGDITAEALTHEARVGAGERAGEGT